MRKRGERKRGMRERERNERITSILYADAVVAPAGMSWQQMSRGGD